MERRLAEGGPLAARMRPQSLDDVVGQERLLGPGRPLRALIEADRLSSAILWGPPGTGKTTIARLIAGATKRSFIGLSAIRSGSVLYLVPVRSCWPWPVTSPGSSWPRQRPLEAGQLARL